MRGARQALFTIGQFAALHGINKKTLMWYDEIGLFKPFSVDEENGYRYYSYYQSSLLETILMLRDMRVPVCEIQAFVSNRSASGMMQTLQTQITEIDRGIARLKETRRRLEEYRQEMEALLNEDLARICVVQSEARRLATVEILPGQPFEEQIEKMIAKTKRYGLPRMYRASYGSMLPVESLYAGEFDRYAMLFMDAPHVRPGRGVHKKPQGSYIRAFCKGSWDKLPARYQDILRYAAENGLVLTGFAYETGINEMVIDSMEDYVTKIEIPVLSAVKKA
ncbi:MAG: MerR family transcriptional regulator [Ruthenibacterium sp.]